MNVISVLNSLGKYCSVKTFITTRYNGRRIDLQERIEQAKQKLERMKPVLPPKEPGSGHAAATSSSVPTEQKTNGIHALVYGHDKQLQAAKQLVKRSSLSKEEAEKHIIWLTNMQGELNDFNNKKDYDLSEKEQKKGRKFKKALITYLVLVTNEKKKGLQHQFYEELDKTLAADHKAYRHDFQHGENKYSVRSCPIDDRHPHTSMENKSSEPVNAWNSILLNEEGEEIFSCVRHGVNDPYKLTGDERQKGAYSRIDQLADAAISSRREKLQNIREHIPDTLAKPIIPDTLNKPIIPNTINRPGKSTLFFVSVSLLTPAPWPGKERAMLKHQLEAWEALEKNGYFLKDTLLDRINVQAIQFNFGVDELSSCLGIGQSYSDKHCNEPALKAMEKKTADYIKWLQNDTTNASKIAEIEMTYKALATFIKEKKHHRDGYTAGRLVIRLASLMDDDTIPCMNCKSGKDRTSILHSLCVADAVVCDGKEITTTEQLLDARQKANKLFAEIAAQDGSRIQALNTAYPGNMVVRHGIFALANRFNLIGKLVQNSKEILKTIKGLADLSGKT